MNYLVKLMVTVGSTNTETEYFVEAEGIGDAIYSAMQMAADDFTYLGNLELLSVDEGEK